MAKEKISPSCYAVVPELEPGERIVLIVYGVEGYYKIDGLDRDCTLEEAQERARFLNKALSVPDDVVDSMIAGSMCGWACKAAAKAREFAEAFFGDNFNEPETVQ